MYQPKIARDDFDAFAKIMRAEMTCKTFEDWEHYLFNGDSQRRVHIRPATRSEWRLRAFLL
jgi:hypothetical protein